MNYVYEVFRSDEDHMWRYRMVANPLFPGLREVMHVSQAYKTGRRGALRGAEAAKRAAAKATIVVIKAS